MSDPTLFPPLAPPTPRELEVLQLLANGGSARYVGKSLKISPRTVTQHVDNLKRKFALSKTSHLIANAIRLQLIK